jgi:predicted component of type VI protein secretion system
MYILRLFHRLEPDRAISAHMVAGGIVRVGRDPAADWTIDDGDCEISRTHFEIACNGDGLTLTPLGANGVFGDGGERLVDGAPASVAPGEAFAFGKYRMRIEAAPFAAQLARSPEATMVFAAPFGEELAVPTDWSDAADLPPIEDDASLLEAFCEGAGLDVSAMSDEDPARIMRRAGAIYRQMVLGLGDLVLERSATKADLQMDRTTIGARGNNPFKWAPTRKLAADLLIGREAGFLSGPDAIRESFEDVKKHMLGTLAGFGAAMRAVVAALSPMEIARRLEGQSHFLKSRQAASWAEFEKRHGEFSAQGLEVQDGPVNQAFIAAYDAKLRDLAAGPSPALTPSPPPGQPSALN